MSYYTEAFRDDERFTARLEEMNKEMDALLLKTSRTRHGLDRTAAEVHIGVPLDFHPQDVSGRAHLAPSVPVGDPPGPQHVRDDLTRSLVLAELSHWSNSHLSDIVVRLVEEQVQKQLLNLRNSVEEVCARQRKVEKAMRDAAEQMLVHRTDMHAALTAAQEDMRRDMEEHGRTVKRQLAAWGEELRRAREDVLALKQHSVSTCDWQEQRVTEALQRQQTYVQEMLETLEHDLQRWRQATSRGLHKESEELRAQHHALEHDVAQVQGMVTSTADMVARCTAEMQRLMEDSVSRSSEVRVCRRDVNRLEMLVECSSIQTALPTDGTGNGVTNDNSTASSTTPIVLNKLPHAMARFSDSLHAILGRIDGLDRHVQQLEMAVARTATVSGGQSPCRGNMRLMDEESPYGRTFASTRHPSDNHLSNAMGVRGHMASGGFARTPSLLSYNDSGNLNPIHSDAAAKSSPTSAPLVTSRKSVDVGGASGRGHSSAAGLGIQPSLTPPMSASPPSATSYLPRSHFGSSSSSVGFHNDAGDSHSMPVVMGEGHTVPDAEGTEVILRSGAAEAGAQRPPEHRPPPRIIPVETVRRRSQPDGVARPTVVKSAVHSTSLSDVSVDASQIVREDALHSLTHQCNVSSCSASSAPSAGNADAAFTCKNRCSSLDNSETVSVAEEGALPKHNSANDEAHPVTAVPHSPVDSYVSDTPAADLDDSKADSGIMSDRDIPEPAQYTPAQGNDSESERDNQVIVRSALD
ncbi:hypothetical protein, conserved [Leishmania tarentolae]|uniref:Uncharacterized protein n=1 Tax=Leishmania tarentolae TaxID=5689 RepID=A0A640KUU1_LEITA|nr:hypothetical protein, conserved [Leishmania tarentolae]